MQVSPPRSSPSQTSLPFATRHARLCELNTIEQAMNICATNIVRDAWARGQSLRVHAWIYGLEDGHLHDLGLDVDSLDAAGTRYGKALQALAERWQSEQVA